MHRVHLGDVSIYEIPKWVIFDCDLDDVIEQLYTKYIDTFKIKRTGKSSHRFTELELKTDGRDKYVISNLFSGFHMWCLTAPVTQNEMWEIFTSGKLKELDPQDLTLEEFKYYCNLMCTISGEYGHISLTVQKFNPDSQEYEDVFE